MSVGEEAPISILTTSAQRTYCLEEFGCILGMLSLKNPRVLGIAGVPILSPRPLICHCYLGVVVR